jgi:hypothetical protein
MSCTDDGSPATEQVGESPPPLTSAQVRADPSEQARTLEEPLSRLTRAQSAFLGAQQANPEAPKSETPLTTIVGLIALIAGYLYFTGWCYAFYYYSTFGIPLQAISVPREYFVASAFEAMVVAPLRTALVLIPAALALFACSRLGKPLLGTMITCLTLVALFPGLCWLARASARVDVLGLRARDGTVPITVRLKPEAARRAPASFRFANRSGRLLLLNENDKSLYVLEQPPPDGGELPMAYVYEIPKENLQLSVATVQNVAAPR